MTQSKRVAYYYHPDIGDFYYGRGHPMKPHRVKMTQNIVLSYDLHHYMEMYVPQPASFEDLTSYHSQDFIKCLQFTNPQNKSKISSAYKNFFKNFGDDDIPVFEGMFQYCQIYTGGSLGAAARIINGQNDVVINWAGGLHHAKKGEASGFCYVNDIVISIMELLKYYHRVMYIDIDVHHGDGVEEAFLTTDRVMTLSFHKFDGDFFPGTGSLDCVGLDTGKYYKINVPLSDGIDDDSYYFKLFNPIVTRAVERFKPSVIVMQCGADSLAGDSLGHFNLSVEGHARCLKMVKTFGLPLIVMGGGGYKIPNVARCWAYETATVLDQDQTISDYIPINHHYAVYGPDAKLRLKAKKDMVNLNSESDITKIRNTVLQRLNYITPTCAHIKEVEMSDYDNRENDMLDLFNRTDNIKQPDYYDQMDVFSSQDSADNEMVKDEEIQRANTSDDIKVIQEAPSDSSQQMLAPSYSSHKSKEYDTNKTTVLPTLTQTNNNSTKINNNIQITYQIPKSWPNTKVQHQSMKTTARQKIPISQLNSTNLQQFNQNNNAEFMSVGGQKMLQPQIKIYDKQQQNSRPSSPQVITISNNNSESQERQDAKKNDVPNMNNRQIVDLLNKKFSVTSNNNNNSNNFINNNNLQQNNVSRSPAQNNPN